MSSGTYAEDISSAYVPAWPYIARMADRGNAEKVIPAAPPEDSTRGRPPRHVAERRI